MSPFHVQTLQTTQRSSAVHRRKTGCRSDTASFQSWWVYLKRRRSLQKVGLFAGVLGAQLPRAAPTGAGSALMCRPDSNHGNGDQQQDDHHQHSWKRWNDVKVAAFIFYNWALAIKFFLRVLLLLPAEADLPPCSPCASPSPDPCTPTTQTASGTPTHLGRAVLSLPEPSN